MGKSNYWLVLTNQIRELRKFPTDIAFDSIIGIDNKRHTIAFMGTEFFSFRSFIISNRHIFFSRMILFNRALEIGENESTNSVKSYQNVLISR